MGAVGDGVVGDVVFCCLLNVGVGFMVELAGSEEGRGSLWWWEIQAVDEC
jgi:hypothetical protein